MTAISAQLAAKISLEDFRRGDRVIVTCAGGQPEVMIVNGGLRGSATIGDARITVRQPGVRAPLIATADWIARGLLTVTHACHCGGRDRECGSAAIGTCVVTGRPVCEEHAAGCAVDRYHQPRCAA
jgi:hypothetical protein